MLCQLLVNSQKWNSPVSGLLKSPFVGRWQIKAPVTQSWHLWGFSTAGCRSRWGQQLVQTKDTLQQVNYTYRCKICKTHGAVFGCFTWVCRKESVFTICCGDNAQERLWWTQTEHTYQRRKTFKKDNTKMREKKAAVSIFIRNTYHLQPRGKLSSHFKG